MSVIVRGLDIVLLSHTGAYFLLISECEYFLCMLWQIEFILYTIDQVCAFVAACLSYCYMLRYLYKCIWL